MKNFVRNSLKSILAAIQIWIPDISSKMRIQDSHFNTDGIYTDVLAQDESAPMGNSI